MSLENYCLSIPCKSYINKYYSGIYGTPFDLDNRSCFTDTILTKLTHEPVRPFPKQRIQIAVKDLDARLSFRIPFDLFYRIDNNVSENKIWALNRYMERCFDNDFMTTVSIAYTFGVEKRTAIEAFSKKYGIILEEDITLDALKKKEHRIRKSETFQNTFLAQLSSPHQFNLRA